MPGYARGASRASMQGALIAVKLTFLLVFVTQTNPGVFARVKHIGLAPGIAVFGVTWLTALAGIGSLAFEPRAWVRRTWSLLLVAATFLSLSFWRITSAFLGLEDFERLIGLLGFAENVVNFYPSILLASASWCAVGVAALNMPPFAAAESCLRLPRILRHTNLLQCVAIAAVGSIVWVRGGEGSNGLSAQYTPIAFAAVLGAAVAMEQPVPPRGVAIVPSQGPRTRHLVVVVDESVRADYLDVNSPMGVQTCLDLAGPSLVSFGTASSTANCSAASNVTMRYGARKATYLDDIRANPSIWEFAKKAGYRTVYIDGQGVNGRLTNFMDAAERHHIDEFIQLESDTTLDERDMQIGKHVRHVIDGVTPTFAYVNKMGCHFPYEGKYPPSNRVYMPVMAKTYFGTETDPKNAGLPQGGDPGERALLVNSYKNCIGWNSRVFWRELLPDALRNAVIVYTADHGQDFHEDGRPGFGTHCADGPTVPAEGMVPLVVLTEKADVLAAFRRAATLNYDRASLFNLFPTLVVLMGYRVEDVTEANGFEPTLFRQLPPDNRQFLSTFFVRLGRKPVWNAIPGSPAHHPSGATAR